MNLHKMTTLLVLLTVVTLLTVACSQGDGDANTLTAPGDTSFRTSGNSGSHIPLALYEVTIDLVNETIETLPIRGADFHLNVLPFMEPPPLVYLNLNWDTLIINPVANIVEVDVVFSHPFGGKNEFMGFDVKGIVITDGSLGGFTDTGVVIPKSTEARLVNADGYTRWWNPTEFHHGGIFGYNDGLLGAPDSYVDYGSTVNGFKYFTDGLYPYSDVMNINTLLRGRFSAGAKNTRHYKIHFGSNPSDFLTFNYAVDASWAAPLKIPPSGMEDFPPEANQTEAFIVKVTELENTLYYTPPIEQGGGFVDLRIDVKDWQGLESIASVRVEAPQLFEGFILADPDPSNDPENIYGTYYASIEGEPTNNNGVQILVTVEDVNGSFEQGGMNEFNGPANTLLAAYQVHTAQVSSNAAPEVGPITSYDLDYLTPTCGTCYTYYASVSDYEDNIGDLIFNWIVTPPGSPPEDYYSIDTPGCDDSDVKTLDIRFNKTGTYVIDLMVEDTDGGYAYSEAPAEPNAGKGGAPPPVGNVVLIVNRDSPIQIIDTVTLDWDQVSGAGGYAVYWADDPYAEPPVFTLLDTTYLSTYTIDPLNADNAYLFTVRSRTNIYNPETESGDSEYAFVEFETAEDDDPYPWTSYYRIYDQNDRFERVVGAGAQAGQMGWRMDVSNTYIQPYAWSVIASREIPDFANVEMCRLEFLREHPCPFDHHGLSVGTADDLIQSSSSDLCDSFDTSMVWQEGANYNEPVCAAIQGRFGEVAGNSGAFQDYCAYPTFSAFELPELLTDRHAAIAYGADNYQRTARVQLDDIAVIVY